MCVALVPVSPQVNLGLLIFPDIDTDVKVRGASRAPVPETSEPLGRVTQAGFGAALDQTLGG